MTIPESSNKSPELLTHDRLDLCAVAENPNTPAETLTLLASHNDSTVRWNVARNSNTSPETLTILAKDSGYWVRSYVAENPNTPQYVKDYITAKNFLINFTFS